MQSFLNDSIVQGRLELRSIFFGVCFFCIITDGACSSRQKSQIYDFVSIKHRKMHLLTLTHANIHIHDDKPVIPTNKVTKFNLMFVICMVCKPIVSISGIEFSLSLNLFNIFSSILCKTGFKNFTFHYL